MILAMTQTACHLDGIVAHGFYPTDGNLHFDADERWTLNMDGGVNLYQARLLIHATHRSPADYCSVIISDRRARNRTPVGPGAQRGQAGRHVPHHQELRPAIPTGIGRYSGSTVFVLALGLEIL